MCMTRTPARAWRRPPPMCMRHELSAAMCADKVRGVLDTGAEVLCAADNSCLMHIGGALKRQRAGVRAMHLAEILAAQES